MSLLVLWPEVCSALVKRRNILRINIAPLNTHKRVARRAKIHCTNPLACIKLLGTTQRAHKFNVRLNAKQNAVSGIHLCTLCGSLFLDYKL